MKKTIVMVCFLIGVLFLTGCAAESPAEVETNCVIVPAQKESGGIEISQANLSSCPGFEAKEYTSPASLSAMIEGVTGQLPSSINACFAIFNVSHGNMTNMLYVKNGWALLNLPVEVFTPWEGDRFLVGSPDSVAKMATIDGDTVIIDGGITNIRQDGAVNDSATIRDQGNLFFLSCRLNRGDDSVKKFGGLHWFRMQLQLTVAGLGDGQRIVNQIQKQVAGSFYLVQIFFLFCRCQSLFSGHAGKVQDGV